MRALVALLWLLGLAVLGAWTAVCTLALAPRTLGLALGLLATAAGIVALPPGVRRLGYCLGWVGVVAAAVPARPEGDLVILSDVRGWTVLLGAVLVLGSGIATLPAPARSRRRPTPPT